MTKPVNKFVSKLLKEKENVFEEIEETQNAEDDNSSSLNTVKIQKGDKNSSFIHNCVISYQNSEFSNTDKVTLNINRGINNKLKMIGIASKITVSDLGNAIINDYLETHKKEIAILMKKINM